MNLRNNVLSHISLTKCFLGLVMFMLISIIILSVNSKFCFTQLQFNEKKVEIFLDANKRKLNRNSNVANGIFKLIKTKYNTTELTHATEHQIEKDSKEIQNDKNKKQWQSENVSGYEIKTSVVKTKKSSKLTTTMTTSEKSTETIEKSTTIATTKFSTSSTTSLGSTESISSTITTTIRTTEDIKKLPRTQKIKRLQNLLKVKNKTCKPIDNVIFLKTHKTGSSTLINIFQRYIMKHNKTVALPSNFNLLGWPDNFKEDFILNHTKAKKYNYICNHARFNKEKMLKVMTNDNTKIITILRDPLSQFKSTVSYLHFEKLFNLKVRKNGSILESFFHLNKKERIKRIQRLQHKGKYLAVNPNTYDMGFPTLHLKPKKEYIIEKVKNDFDFIMISNYMSESLVLLKDLFCWDLIDIVYFTLNKRPNKFRQKIKNEEKTRDDVYKWNDVDSAMFEIFNKTLWKEIKRKGNTFNKDLKDLKEANKLLADLCLQKSFGLDKSQPWFPIIGLKLKSNLNDFPFKKLCEDMVKSELVFDGEIKRHFSHLATS